MKPIHWYARRYIERFGFHLVPIEPGRKFPRTKDWGHLCLSDPDAAEAYYTAHPDWNMGVVLGPSRMVSVDVDCLESFRVICDVFGIDLDGLIADTPTIQGASKGLRMMFRLPDGVTLPYRKMSWRSRNDPSGAKHKQAVAAAQACADPEREARIRAVAKRWASYCVFELRSVGDDGRQRQDVLPPSIHPDTGRPYRWVTQPTETWPTLPAWLLAIWKDWDKFKPQFAACCPWAAMPEVPESRIKPHAVQIKGDGVIDQFNAAHDLRTMLEAYGYTEKGKRYLSPHSSTGLPGVVVLPDGSRCWIHHASDPLCSEERGTPVNPFDLFCYYDHGGDLKRAVSAAADAMGLPRRRLEAPAHAPAHAPAPVAVSASAQPAPFTDHMSPLPYVNGANKPLNHIGNLAEVCNRLGVTVRYNVIKKTEEILIPGESFTMDNRANASLAWLVSECSMFGFPTGKVGEFITYIADKNPFNPVARWVESRPWDGVSRMDDFYATITAKGESDWSVKALKETLMKRWMISAIAAAYQLNGISAAGVLTLQGGQYLGKTKWFKQLVPPDLDLVKDGLSLKPDDKDSVKRVVSYWLVELGELDATFRKSDIAALKSFLTKDSDELRLAYARKESQFARRTIFFASVNPLEFLNDPTGNRRYWTIACERIDHSHTLDMQQVWAEVLAIWRSGEGYYLLPDEMRALNDHNEGFVTPDPVEERLLSRLDWDTLEVTWRWEQASIVLNEIGFDRPTKGDSMTAAQFIRKRNGNQSRRNKGKTQLLCPPMTRRADY